MSAANGGIREMKMLFCFYTSWILFGATSFRPGLLMKFEKLSFVLQGLLLKVDIFLLNRYSFLYTFSMF